MNNGNNENDKTSNTIFFVAMLLITAILIVPFTWFGPKNIAEETEEDKAPIYKVDDFYKACGTKFIELYAVDDSYDNCNVNSFYTDGSAYYIDFSDLIKGERYLCKIEGNDNADKKATFNLSTENFLTYTEILDEMDEPDKIAAYVSFYCEEYSIKDVEGLESVRTTMNAVDFKDLLSNPKPEDKNKESLSESKDSEDESNASESKASESKDAGKNKDDGKSDGVNTTTDNKNIV